MRAFLLAASAFARSPEPVGPVCSGSIELQGHGSIQTANAYWNVPGELAGDVEVSNGEIHVFIKGRTYFSDTCVPTEFSNSRYSKLFLLGKRLRWKTDISGTDCGCNAAFYLGSLHQNAEVSQCLDHYCDANDVCGVRCTEIDLQEANRYAFHSVLHLPDDNSGSGLGYGGGGLDWSWHRDWTREEYGPGAHCIDTNRPFEVEVGFPLGSNGQLRAITTRLSQIGSPCDLNAEVATDSYIFRGRHSASELTQALHEGMTPIVSYWKHENMQWMDGKGADGLGPCAVDRPDQCGPSVKFYDFALESLDERLI
ncbi:egl1 [Symbiodinium natans]|uniref:cellulose 1,4-beta-cellobiosidase (non-reducing end) n=1 Tax=Symbiodinium natans TaxID=878477 RepID=A0A812IA81_9DINO|nr:egl1 [Symbiodinium natans]